MDSLTFRLAQTDDYQEIVKLSEGIYEGHDYLPLKFSDWLQRENLHIVLAYFGSQLVGLQAYFVVDECRTFIRRASRMHPNFRGQGLIRSLREFMAEHAKSHYPCVQRERFTTNYENVNCTDQTKLYESKVGAFNVDKEKCSQITEGKINLNIMVDIQQCPKKHFSDILSAPLMYGLFPNNVIIVNSCPFAPLRSNIDYILQETDEIFVEKCADTFPKSISFGTFSPRSEFLHWLASVYCDDPNLYEAHLRYQFRHACRVIKNDFVFMSFHDKSMSPLVKKLLEEELQLQVCDHYKNKTMKVYETKCIP